MENEEVLNENRSNNKLIVVSEPNKRSYKPGSQINYDGLVVKFNDVDVTNSVKFNIEEGTTWKSKDKKLTVIVSYKDDEDGEVYNTSFELKKKIDILFIALIITTLAASSTLIAYSILSQAPKADVGSHVIPQGEMTKEEAIEMLDEQVESSRITVSISPRMKLYEDGNLRVNFIVKEPNNGLSERMEIEQGGNIIYKSGIVEPGYYVEYANVPQAELGDAVVTIYAVTENGADSGNPVSLEVQIVDSDYETPQFAQY